MCVVVGVAEAARRILTLTARCEGGSIVVKVTRLAGIQRQSTISIATIDLLHCTTKSTEMRSNNSITSRFLIPEIAVALFVIRDNGCAACLDSEPRLLSGVSMRPRHATKAHMASDGSVHKAGYSIGGVGLQLQLVRRLHYVSAHGTC